MNEENLYSQLQKINKDKESCLLAIEKLLKDQLQVEPHNTELWLRLAQFEYNPHFQDPNIITSYLQKIFEYDPSNIDAHIIIGYTSYMLTPKMPDDVFRKLSELQLKDPEKSAMLEIVKALYYHQEKDDKMYEQSLLNAIRYCPSFVDPYLDLGKLYLRDKRKEEGSRLLKLGLKNIKRVYPDEDPISDITDYEEFYNWALKGIHATQLKINSVVALF